MVFSFGGEIILLESTTVSAPPKVTVVILVYNRGQYIAEAINSVLAQSFTNFELLLIDDGSRDNSVKIMQSYTDPRMRMVRNEQNLGIPKTRNKGIALARGEYLAVLDSDDYAYPDRLAKQVAFLDRHQDYAMVGSWVATIEEGQPSRRIEKLPSSPVDIQTRLLFRCCLNHSTLTARTAVLQEYGYREQFTVSEDFDLYLRLVKTRKLCNLPEPLVYYRKHTTSVTQEKLRLVDETNWGIMRRQLNELGVECTETDLDRHMLLSSKKQLFTPDLEYLNWAETWLLGLQAANQRTRQYHERPLASAAGERWLKMCERASTSMGRVAWKRFWMSPLRKGAWMNERRKLLLLALRTLGCRKATEQAER